MGQDGEKWANYLEQHCEAVQELMKLTPNKRRFYLQGIRAATRVSASNLVVKNTDYLAHLYNDRYRLRSGDVI